MAAYIENSGVSRNISELRNLRDEVNLWCDTLRKSERTAASVAKIKGLEADDLKIKVVLAEIAENYHKAFHPVWGQMFLAGYQDSRFAFYVENYACLYTSKATNFGLVSTLRAFRTTAERLPHDKLLADHGNSFKKIR